MPLADLYLRQVALLLRIMPAVAEEECFALKGGTAINLFVRDLPRLSVDIDLTYLPVADRATSLEGVDSALERIADRIKRGVPGTRIQRGKTREEQKTIKLLVDTGGTTVKIEVTPVLRGCVFAPEQRETTDAVQERIGYAAMQVVSFADLFAGKIVAALDRQHPRDLFDVRELIAREGIRDDLRRAFLVYLVSHGRPMAEVLSPRRKDLTAEFAQGFEGMTAEPVPLEALAATRERLIELMVAHMPPAHRAFLIALKGTGDADWEGLGLAAARELPAVQWRLQNLAKLDAKQRATLTERLTTVLKGKRT